MDSSHPDSNNTGVIVVIAWKKHLGTLSTEKQQEFIQRLYETIDPNSSILIASGAPDQRFNEMLPLVEGGLDFSSTGKISEIYCPGNVASLDLLRAKHPQVGIVIVDSADNAHAKRAILGLLMDTNSHTMKSKIVPCEPRKFGIGILPQIQAAYQELNSKNSTDLGTQSRLAANLLSGLNGIVGAKSVGSRDLAGASA